MKDQTSSRSYEAGSVPALPLETRARVSLLQRGNFLAGSCSCNPQHCSGNAQELGLENMTKNAVLVQQTVGNEFQSQNEDECFESV